MVDQLPTTFDHIPNACLIICLRICAAKLEGMVAGSYDWADLGNTFPQLLLACFKTGEGRTNEVEYRLWYLEEGIVDERANYTKQRLRGYQGEQLTRRQRQAAANRRTRNFKDSHEQQTRTQVIITARKKCHGKS